MHFHRNGAVVANSLQLRLPHAGAIAAPIFCSIAYFLLYRLIDCRSLGVGFIDADEHCVRAGDGWVSPAAANFVTGTNC